MFRKPTHAIALGLFLLMGASAASRASQIVTSSLDNSSGGTLREAIAAAAPGETISFDAGLTDQTISLSQGQLVIDKDLTISGPGASHLTISGGLSSRVIYVGAPGGTPAVTISGLTISNGIAQPGEYGGGILNQGNLTLTNVAVSNNTSYDGGSGMQNEGFLSIDGCTFSNNYQTAVRGSTGGAIRNVSASDVTIARSIFSGNSAYSAGAIYNVYTAGSVRVSESTFVGNTAAYIGGAVYVEGGVTTIENSTFSGNSVTGTVGLGFGGALYDTNNATVNVAFCTFAGNSAIYTGGIYSSGSPVNVKNSLFSGNSGGDLSGWITGFGVNLTTDNTGIPGFTQASASSLKLQPLADNGGPTPTIALGVGSAAVNAAPDGSDLNGAPVTIDQRGQTRPMAGKADVGAYEDQSPPDLYPPTLVWGTASPPANAFGWNNGAVTLPFSVTDDQSGVSPSSPTGPLTFSSEGASQTQDVTVFDNAGNSKTYTSPAVNVDLTAPTTAFSPVGKTVTLTTTDGLSGLKDTFYQLDGGAVQTYHSPFDVPVGGLHTVTYWGVDVADNVESAQTRQVDTRYAVSVTVSSASGRRGAKVTLQASVIQSSNNSKVSNVAVTFTVDNTFVGNATASKGVAKVTYTIPSSMTMGSHTIRAVSQPNGTYQSGTGTGTLTVK